VPEQISLPRDVVPPAHHEIPKWKRQRSVLLVFACTVFGAAAQTLMKLGANTLTYPTLTQTLTAMLTNVPLMTGYCLYGISTLLLIMALRHGELSLLYPVIALTYVWVSILSVLVFHEHMGALKLMGIATIVCGVAVLGRGSTK
jgi:multidrug transporter EmrE-like cation transporter